MSIRYERKLDPIKTYQAIDHIKKRFREQLAVKNKIWDVLSNLNGKVANKNIMDVIRKAMFPEYSIIGHSHPDRLDIEIFGHGAATFMDYHHKCYFKIPLETPTGKTRPVLRLQLNDEFIKEQVDALAILEKYPFVTIADLCVDYNQSLQKIYDIYRLFDGELQYTVGMIFDPTAYYNDRGDIFVKGTIDV